MLIQASTVKDLPDMERLKSAKFTGLRWDIDPVVIEYFRYLLNDVVGRAGRKTSTTQQAQNNRNISAVVNKNVNKPLKATSEMLTSDRRLSVNPNAASAVSSDARRRSMFRQFSAVQQQQQQRSTVHTRSSPPNKALARWKKVSLTF